MAKLTNPKCPRLLFEKKITKLESTCILSKVYDSFYLSINIELIKEVLFTYRELPAEHRSLLPAIKGWRFSRSGRRSK